MPGSGWAVLTSDLSRVASVLATICRHTDWIQLYVHDASSEKVTLVLHPTSCCTVSASPVYLNGSLDVDAGTKHYLLLQTIASSKCTTQLHMVSL
jgi:hypothetical protein